MSELEIPIRDEQHSDEDDWDSRTLCPDETCVGTLGADGRCRLCATESPDGPPTRTASTAASDEDADAAPTDEPEASLDDEGDAHDEGSPDEDRDEDDDWSRRELCPDEMCVGTLDPLGRCSVCGATR